MKDETDPSSERATAELAAIAGALERSREGSAQARRGEVVGLRELADREARPDDDDTPAI